ncbi:KilA-N domain-containing protein [Aulosira sp. FACHB-615]|uniref:KilA-N domain-containing protein n=1 Tax=Aulosira sp. FACHB-615 TaxID=2692777 RepID=UPI0016862FA8|nr:KilA-N domain-containing protein [Aulosira sp. FACHB-615]MBD2491370.1 KilA-N domain-containing protein [Aulosira sp. FACHB-615]
MQYGSSAADIFMRQILTFTTNNFMTPEFTLEIAQQLHNSNQIIDFDWAWSVLGYSTKSNAKRMLTAYFERNFDYFVQPEDESLEPLPYQVFITWEENSKAGRPVEKIYLTTECFKEMGMLSKSEQGRQIRKYFLQCETIAKESVKLIPQLQQQIQELQNNFAQLQAQIQTLLPPSSDFMPPGWDAEVWQSLAPQDKRHFRFLFRRRNFRPSTKNEPLALPTVDTEAWKQKQRDEVAQLIGEVSPEEKQQFQAVKRQKLREFWSQAPEEDQENMPF